MPDAKKQTAYVLPEGVASSTEPQVFPGFPGAWLEGEPIAVSDLGLDEKEAAQLVADLGLPHKKTTAAATRDASVMLSGAELRSESIVDTRSTPSPIPGLTREELEARVEEEKDLASGLSPVIEAAVNAAPKNDELHELAKPDKDAPTEPAATTPAPAEVKP